MDKSKILIVVDMQNDFVDGALGSPAAQAIVDKVCRKIDGWDGYVLFTFDTHYDDYLETVEGAHIPVAHCIDGTPGWQLNPEVAKRHTERTFAAYKETFGAITLIDVVNMLEIKEIQLIGLCTDICVVSNAMLLRAAKPDAIITVDASCCAGTSPENHSAALTVMKQCCIDVINEE